MKIQTVMMMMSLRLTPPLSLLLLLMISGVVVCQYGWRVYYTPRYICAVKGSTVTMGCSYTYPSGYTVMRAFWSREQLKEKNKEPPDLYSHPYYKNRVLYLRNTWTDSSLSLSDVREQDKDKYYFTFITYTAEGIYEGLPGVELSVTELQVEMSADTVVEGGEVTLTCKTTCRLTSAVTWYKTGSHLSPVSSSNPLRLSPVTQQDAGSYRCVTDVQGQHYYSPTVTLNVEYPPKSVSVSISPSGEIEEGSSVTLTCSSNANPPALYNWYKGTVLKSDGQTYTINNISSEDSGHYKCKTKNKHGHKYSDKTTVTVLYPPKNVSVSISPSGEIEEGSSVTLTCSSDANPPVRDYTWYKVNESSPVGSGQSYSFTMNFSSSGWFYCETQNKYGSQRSAAVSVIITGNTSVLLYVLLGVTVICGCFLAIVVILFMRRKRRSADEAKTSQENPYSSVNLSTDTNDPTPDPHLLDQTGIHYASIKHQKVPRKAERSPVQSGSGVDVEVEYATVQHRGDRVVEKTEEDDDDQYANIRLNFTSAANKSNKPI